MRAPLRLRSLRQATGLAPPPLAKAFSHIVVVVVVPIVAPISAPPPPSIAPAKEVVLVVEVDAPATFAGPVTTHSSNIVVPLFSAGVATTSAPAISPPSSSAPPIPPTVVLASTPSSSSSRPHVSLDHLYTFNNPDSLWGTNYKSKQKTLVGFVSAFHKNLIRSIGV